MNRDENWQIGASPMSNDRLSSVERIVLEGLRRSDVNAAAALGALDQYAQRRVLEHFREGPDSEKADELASAHDVSDIRGSVGEPLEPNLPEPSLSELDAEVDSHYESVTDQPTLEEPENTMALIGYGLAIIFPIIGCLMLIPGCDRMVSSVTNILPDFVVFTFWIPSALLSAIGLFRSIRHGLPERGMALTGLGLSLAMGVMMFMIYYISSGI